MQRIEKELQQKELRQEMKLRLARMQNQTVQKPQIVIIGGGGSGSGSMGGMGGYSSGRSDHFHGAIGGNASGSGYVVGDPLMHHMVGSRGATMPSPLTPNSTDELLPSVDEAQEVRQFKKINS